MDSDNIDNIENLGTQLDIFNVIERTCSVLSLVGCIFIIVTFCVSDAFHKPINRLVFYASLYVVPLKLTLNPSPASGTTRMLGGYLPYFPSAAI